MWGYLLGAGALMNVALAITAWYYRHELQTARAALAALQAADAGQVALDLTLARQVTAARTALAARQKIEAQNDALSAQAASGDAAAAAALLNGLHPREPGAGPGATDPVPAATSPAVPRPTR